MVCIWAVHISVTDAKAQLTDLVRRAAAYALWGKGNHPAALNLGDCFSYAAAQERSCPLLFIGNEFAQTDLTPGL